MSTLHIYTAPLQPATHFVDPNIDPEMEFNCSPRRLIFTECCRKWRWAKYVQVQVYADGIRRWCAEGRGCKGAR